MVINGYSEEGQKFVLISSDTDLLPAIQNVMSKGHKVVYVGFNDKLTNAISTNSTETEIIRDAEIIEAYEVSKVHS